MRDRSDGSLLVAAATGTALLSAASVLLRPEGAAVTPWWPVAPVVLLLMRSLAPGDRRRAAGLAAALGTGAGVAAAGLSPVVALACVLGTAVEAGVAARLLPPPGAPPVLHNLPSLARLGGGLLAGVGVAALLVALAVPGAAGPAAVDVLAGHGSALLLVLPLVLLPERRGEAGRRERLLQALAVLLGVLALALLGPDASAAAGAALLPGLTWAALRCGTRTAAWQQVLAVSAAALAVTLAGDDAGRLLEAWLVPGTVLLALGVATEERRVAREDARRLGLHDPLTGVGNRRLLEVVLEQALGAAARGARSVLLVMDLDGFKAVNDQHGHDAGDAVLIAVARRLVDAVRVGDTVARLGGDEFAVLCRLAADDPSDGRATADRLARLVQQPVHHRGRALEVGVSVGVVPVTAEHAAPELLREADARMYTAKRAGGQLAPVPWSRYVDRALEAVLADLKDALGLEVAFVCEITGSAQVFRVVDADRPLPFGRGTGQDLAGSYCALVLSGEVEPLLQDTRSDPRTRDLLPTAAADIGCYLGVPVRLQDGSLLGTLCGFTAAPGPERGEADVQALQDAAGVVSALVSAERRTGAREALVGG